MDFQHQQPENWKWGIFYYNKKDHRAIVPKLNPLFGWTFNFAHPIAYIFLGFVVLLAIFQSLCS